MTKNLLKSQIELLFQANASPLNIVDINCGGVRFYSSTLRKDKNLLKIGIRFFKGQKNLQYEYVPSGSLLLLQKCPKFHMIN